MLRSFRLASVALLLAACSESEPAFDAAAASSSGAGGAATASATGDGSSSATAGSGGAGGSDCTTDALALRVDRSGGYPSRIHVPVVVGGVEALFFLDTGSALTFLLLGPDDPSFVPDYGEVTIGCQTITLPGRGGLAPHDDEGGLPVLGFLGADYLLAGATLLDTEAETLVRRPPGDVPEEAAGWAVLDYDDVQGHMIAPATLDGVGVRLMLDTGAQHALWLGVEGEPGDIELETQDAEGTVFTLYYGDVDLGMASREPVQVPVLRAPSFPYLEQTVAALGGNIHGLLGLSSFRNRPVLVDGASGEVRVGPLP